MNKTVITVAVVAGVAVAGYFAWKMYQESQGKVKQQQTAGNSNDASSNSTGNTITAVGNTLHQLADTFGI